MKKYVEVKDILESAKKYGRDKVLYYMPEKARDNTKLGNAHDCTWIPIGLKGVDGSRRPLNALKIAGVTNFSKIRIPGNDDKKKEDKMPKYMSLAFRKITKEDILIEDCIPRVCRNPAKQAIANKKASDLADQILANTNNFVEALEIIDLSYKALVKDIKEKEATFDFVVNKDSVDNIDGIKVSSIVQRDMKDPKDRKKKIVFEYPLYRLRVGITKDGRIGITYTPKNGDATFKTIVFDAVATNSKENSARKPIPATVDGEPLTKDNVDKVITSRSLIGGIIKFSDITISVRGISLSNQFESLYVKTRVKSDEEVPFNHDEMEMMGSTRNRSDYEDDSESESESEKVKNPIQEEVKVTQTDSGSDIDDQNDEHDDIKKIETLVSESVVEVPQPEIRKKPPVRKSVGKKKTVKVTEEQEPFSD